MKICQNISNHDEVFLLIHGCAPTTHTHKAEENNSKNKYLKPYVLVRNLLNGH
jgi:hypothetical protein